MPLFILKRLKNDYCSEVMTVFFILFKKLKSLNLSKLNCMKESAEKNKESAYLVSIL